MARPRTEADEMARDRAERAIAHELDDYRRAEDRMAGARDALHDKIRQALRDGHTAYRLAQVTGLSQAHLSRLRQR